MVRWDEDAGRPRRIVVYGARGQVLVNVRAVPQGSDALSATISLALIGQNQGRSISVGLVNSAGESRRSSILQCPSEWTRG